MVQLLAISGSLRRTSLNTALLRAAAQLAPTGVEILLFAGLGDLPLFNPDLEGNEPRSVLEFRAQLQLRNGVLISSPEYAHGVSGVLKNALDWVVGSGEFSGKPVAIFNSSPRASIAQESLAEIIRTMDARLIADAALALPLLGKNMGTNAIVANPEMNLAIRRALRAMVDAVGA